MRLTSRGDCPSCPVLNSLGLYGPCGSPISFSILLGEIGEMTLGGTVGVGARQYRVMRMMDILVLVTKAPALYGDKASSREERPMSDRSSYSLRKSASSINFPASGSRALPANCVTSFRLHKVASFGKRWRAPSNPLKKGFITGYAHVWSGEVPQNQPLIRLNKTCMSRKSKYYT